MTTETNTKSPADKYREELQGEIIDLHLYRLNYEIQGWDYEELKKLLEDEYSRVRK